MATGHVVGTCAVLSWGEALAVDPMLSVVVEAATPEDAALAFTRYTYAAYCPGCTALVTVVSAYELRAALTVAQ